ncbi:MAG: Heme O synthase, protoheme IX farnesyltransferase COX10-CtaB [uncultured Thermomicrobiales bacterium]|uniref:Protoheme IX farnesyltransferase n=1 Tax=uncultured Thermomicrobiales bacterium TaxID=1645740 RepID=A0A6J4V7M2_9BACT|nr:MAG: Heme O synthase, protoheme IX farnesyltransferase COX10-CtaB [uncultured Thermomicrobiales bacterium]
MARLVDTDLTSHRATAPVAAVEIGTGSSRLDEFRALVSAYIALTKPGILTLLLVTTLGAMLIAERGLPGIGLVIWTLIGGALAASGANALNCFIDRDIDAIMPRTQHRGTASGAIPPRAALVFGLTLTVASVVLLAVAVNPLAAGLALAGNAYYVLIYTALLKRRTPQNIVIGGAAGAFPPVVGWAAVTGDTSWIAWALFAVVFFWTPPHFWALALLKVGEYGRASVPMLPVVAGEATTRLQILIYTVLLTLVQVAMVWLGFSWIYLAGVIVINTIFLGQAVALFVDPSKRRARQMFLTSLWYLFVYFAFAAADRMILT